MSRKRPYLWGKSISFLPPNLSWPQWCLGIRVTLTGKIGLFFFFPEGGGIFLSLFFFRGKKRTLIDDGLNFLGAGGIFARGEYSYSLSGLGKQDACVHFFLFLFFLRPRRGSPIGRENDAFFRNWKYTRRFGINKKSLQIVTRFRHVSISHYPTDGKNSKNGLFRHFLTQRNELQ